ncbi:MAG: hypothetical protein A2Y13_04450 [Planctomycetes bacterium GWC2_45_44]|nr:MAG: hypothetical protein A2Y13_04450 [Planctomycetes bacterium GWC2_45_44]HBR19424.1 hypothetical protein [Phycisphaerales bacterium]
MSNKNIMLVFAILAVFCAPVTFGALRWSIDFENGFNATAGAFPAGTPVVVGGDVNNPFDSNQEVYLKYDTTTLSNTIRVGRSGTKGPYYGFVDIDPNIFGSSGKITLDFKIPTGLSPNFNVCTFLSPSEQTGENPAYQTNWFVGINGYMDSKLPSNDFLYVRATDWYDADPDYAKNQLNWTIKVPTFTAGWHTYEFAWYETQHNSPTHRDRADYYVKVDGSLIAVIHDTLWVRPGYTKVNVGCYWTGVSTPDFYCGAADGNIKPIYLDNIKVWDYTPDQCGEMGAMSYMPGDLTHNCYVDMKDIKIFAEQWLQCTTPADPNCDE